MYQLMVVAGLDGQVQSIRKVKPPSEDLGRLYEERDAMNRALLNSGVRLDQARVVVRPVFTPCEPGVCTRCDHTREVVNSGVTGPICKQGECSICDLMRVNPQVFAPFMS
jgi:hypothetical protein